MVIRCVWEHNGDDTLLHCVDYVGAYARGETLNVAMGKMQEEITSYASWSSKVMPEDITIEIIQENISNLQIADADSDVIFDEEKKPLSRAEYEMSKELALKSAVDFHELYLSIPQKNESCLSVRTTFYGQVPRTAQEMYVHTKNVNSYYFAEIGVDVDNEGTIVACRQRGFECLEQNPRFLDNSVFDGSYGELWSVRKMLRRFIWHDRIHAKAMYRMALKTFGTVNLKNNYKFDR